MLFLFLIQPYERTSLAPEYYRWTGVLVLEEAVVGKHFYTTLLVMAALELHLRKQVPSHPVHFVELGFVAAEGAGIGVLREPTGLAVSAQRLLAGLALQRVLQYVVAH
eukprot:CAMPEP_0202970920 /NCGR_PEP_ID=MMETSP1396-20130829/21765_1 /ASSEMBLY_ACC=CAM_ASM_000872 /TAXON_ID= /ORGANISM="Pseudokeronopsis sp., Strain Brazil" /LENGTH=107 /DNA_ID=CAMNT_0049699791 /DNA_START=258 /DNA_END=578 /DNA_ORIENTATION=-